MEPIISNQSPGASAPGPGPGTGPLGNNTKSSSPPRTRRYHVQRAIQRLARSEAVQRGMQPYDWQRVSKCRHTRVADDVEVMQSDASAYYRGVAVCGSVWACPVCSAKIQEGRRQEIAAVMAWAYRQGYECQMVTFTMPHHSGQSLDELLKIQAKALGKLRSGSPALKFRERIAYIGMIRGLELTHGHAGWHPHTHEIWITKPLDDHDKRHFSSWLKRRWFRQCEASGLPIPSVKAFFRHAVDVRYACDTSDYLAKQDDESYLKSGVDRELAQSHSKKGRRSGRHPFQVVTDYQDKGDPRDAFIFIEYLEGMKGKRQLFFSRGLKSLAGLNDVSDDDLASDETEHPVVLASLDLWSWKAVTDGGLRAALLDSAESGTLQAFRNEHGLYKVDRFMIANYWETRAVVLNDEFTNPRVVE